MGRLFKLAAVVAPKHARFDAVMRSGLREGVELLRELGYDGAEISLINPSSVRPGELRKLLGDLDLPAFSTGLNYANEGLSLTSPDPLIRRRAEERLVEFAELASHFGSRVVVGLMRGVSGGDRDRALKNLVDALRRLGRVAVSKGVEYVLEPLNRYETDLVNTVEEAVRVVEEVGEGVRLLLDTFHMNIEERSIEGAIARANGLIGHFHIADSNRLAPGWGHLDFRSILRALRDTGYSGWLSAEIVPKPDPRSAFEQTIEFIRPIVAGL